MKKFVIVKDNKVKRVVVSKDESKIRLGIGESLRSCSGKIRLGSDYVVDQIIEVKASEVNRRSFKDMAIGAGIAAAIAGIAGAVHYFGGF